VLPLSIDRKEVIDVTREYNTLNEVKSSSAVISVEEDTIFVEDYANCSFFNRLFEGEIPVGNISTTENGKLKVNIR